MRTRMICGLAAGLLSFASGAVAQNVDWAGHSWEVDRYKPEEFTPIGPFQGRNDVLKILLGDEGFAINRGGFGAGFYDTQGRKTTVNLPIGSFASAELYVPGSWAAQQATNWQSTGLWGSTFKPTGPGTETVIGYPIIAFFNSALDNGNNGNAVADGGRIQVFDDDTGEWHVVSSAVNFNAWNTLRFEIHADRYEFYLNGKLVYVDTNIDKDPQAYLKEIFLNSKNNNSAEYAAFYANVLAALLQDPTKFEIVGSVPGMTEYYQYSTIGDLASRRGLQATEHFSPYDYVWMYGGGTTGQFDLSNSSSFDGTSYFARFGIDVIQPMESMRIGFTNSAGRAETESDATGGSADSDNYSAGAYVTYATRELYVDVIGEYAWGKWDVNVPGQTQANLDVKTFVASGEIGTSLWLAKGIRLIPNASLLLLNSNYDDIAFNLVNVTYDTETSLIGRVGARFQYEVPTALGGSRVYVGVSAVKDLAGDTTTIVQSPTFPGGNSTILSGGFEETAVQFAGGFDLTVAKATRLYGDASYLTGGDADTFRGTGGFTFNW